MPARGKYGVGNHDRKTHRSPEARDHMLSGPQLKGITVSPPLSAQAVCSLRFQTDKWRKKNRVKIKNTDFTIGKLAALGRLQSTLQRDTPKSCTRFADCKMKKRRIQNKQFYQCYKKSFILKDYNGASWQYFHERQNTESKACSVTPLRREQPLLNLKVSELFTVNVRTVVRSLRRSRKKYEVTKKDLKCDVWPWDGTAEEVLEMKGLPCGHMIGFSNFPYNQPISVIFE